MRHPLALLVALAILPVIGTPADPPRRPHPPRFLEQQARCTVSCLGSPDRLTCRCQCMGFARDTPRLATTLGGCVSLERTCVDTCRRGNGSQVAACTLRCFDQERICIASYACPKD